MSLMAIDNLQELNELLPEAVAREMSVLVVSKLDDELTLACPREQFGKDDRERIEFILSRSVNWQPHALKDIRSAIPIAYGTIKQIAGCDWKFRNKCPEQWVRLERSEDDTVRNCNICNKNVYLCLESSQVKEHAKIGNCVCYVNDSLEGESLGDVMLQEFDDEPINFSDNVENPNNAG